MFAIVWLFFVVVETRFMLSSSMLRLDKQAHV